MNAINYFSNCERRSVMECLIDCQILLINVCEIKRQRVSQRQGER